MKPLREAAVTGILRTPFVKPGTCFSGVPESALIKLVASELLFSSTIDPALVDTLLIASSYPIDRHVIHEIRITCRKLGFDPHVRVISLNSGTVTDLSAFVSAALKISSGESEAAMVIGVGIGGALFSQDTVDTTGYPAAEVIERYPSTFEEREEYVKNSISKAHDALLEGYRMGLVQIPLPPLFGEIVNQDHFVETDQPDERQDAEESSAELPPVFTCDFTAPQREGLGALLLTTAERARSLTDEDVFIISGSRHIGVPPHLRGAGAAVALDSLLTDNQLSFADVEILEIMETTSAQVLSSLKALRTKSPGGNTGGTETADGFGAIVVNPSGGSLATGYVPSCSGIRMLAGLTEHLTKRKARLGAVACEAAGSDAVALLLERA
jgi:acetyl-CoA acyltransferase